MSTIAKSANGLAAVLLVTGFAGPVHADSCEKSRDYILEGLAGDLVKSGKAYQDLFKACQETLNFSNVKDAYIIKGGAIAIDPVRNTAMATAATLAQFCERFPQNSVLFLTPREQRQARTAGLTAMMSADNATSCNKFRAAR